MTTMTAQINTANEEKVQAALNSVQQKSKVRTIEIDDVNAAIKSIESHLNRLLYKKDWIGLEFDCDPVSHREQIANSYSGVPESTQFRLVRRSSGWFIDNVRRAPMSASTQRITPLNINDRKLEIMSKISDSKFWG